MMHLTKLVALGFALAALAAADNAYTGYKVLRVDLGGSVDSQSFLRELVRRGGGDLVPWNDFDLRGAADLMVPPARLGAVLAELSAAGLAAAVGVEDVGALVEAERGRAADASNCTVEGSGYQGELTFDAYYDVEVFHEYFDYLESAFDFFSTTSVGRSYEGNDMRVAKICKGDCGDRFGMWVDAGIHAREWIAPAAAMYLVQELVENDGDHPWLTEDLDWYILPVVNPDGYAYTRAEGGDRFWRMTRAPNAGGCVGADANRNWGYEWGPEGSSLDPCDPNQTYHGDAPFSEQEIVNVAAFLSNMTAAAGPVVYYNAMHSYLQAILLPWSYTSDPELPYLDELFALAEPAAAAMAAVDGQEYAVDTIPNLVGETAGAATDWVIAEAGVPYAYGMELRGGLPVGLLGFVLPPDEICPNAREVFAFHRAAGEYIIDKLGVPEGAERR